MTDLVDVLWHGLKDSLLMAWTVWWALVLGFAISAIVQAWVPRERIERLMSGSGARSVGWATGLGAASSSCSYAAIAIAKSLFQKGASATECAMTTASAMAPESAVLHVGGLHYASEKAVVEEALSRRPGVILVEANPVAQTATLVYDAAVTSVEALREWVEECGYHCAGQSAPGHVCDPLVAPDHGPHDQEAAERADEADGHGHGGHAGMSMAGMVADMRNRFVVSLIFTVPIVLWSGVGSGLIGSDLATPFGIGRNWWLLLLSLPVVLYSSSIFFAGAWKALRARTLDMMVLVAVAVGIAFAYSAAVTFGLSGETFYDAAAMLATFVLLGHWFEMRARGGANDAMRALLDLAPPRAVVIRNGDPVEVPTAEVRVGDPLLIRPGAKVPVDGEVIDTPIIFVVRESRWIG